MLNRIIRTLAFVFVITVPTIAMDENIDEVGDILQKIHEYFTKLERTNTIPTGEREITRSDDSKYEEEIRKLLPNLMNNTADLQDMLGKSHHHKRVSAIELWIVDKIQHLSALFDSPPINWPWVSTIIKQLQARLAYTSDPTSTQVFSVSERREFAKVYPNFRWEK